MGLFSQLHSKMYLHVGNKPCHVQAQGTATHNTNGEILNDSASHTKDKKSWLVHQGCQGSKHITRDGQTIIKAGAGNDTLRVQYHADGTASVYVNGEEFALSESEASNFAVDGQGGNDNISVDSRFSCGKTGLTLIGGSGNDTIRGAHGAETIHGGAGNDTIHSRGGDDSIFAGDGNDTVFSGTGNDEVFGGRGRDVIMAGSGNDTVYGGDGDDRIDSASGNDTVYGGLGNDTILSLSGNNTIHGESGHDDIKTGNGNDTITGGWGLDRIDAGAGFNSAERSDLWYSSYGLLDGNK